ncbi:hypothetical protein [Streptomyces sp. NPDC055400]
MPLFQVISQLTVAVDRSCRHERFVTLLEWCVPLMTPAAAPVPRHGPYFRSIVRVVSAGVEEMGGS